MVLAMCWYAVTRGDAFGALAYIFEPHWERLGWPGVMEALPHAFFTLVLGMGVMMGVGSYMPIVVPLHHNAITVDIVVTGLRLMVGDWEEGCVGEGRVIHGSLWCTTCMYKKTN